MRPGLLLPGAAAAIVLAACSPVGVEGEKVSVDQIADLDESLSEIVIGTDLGPLEP